MEVNFSVELGSVFSCDWRYDFFYEFIDLVGCEADVIFRVQDLFKIDLCESGVGF